MSFKKGNSLIIIEQGQLRTYALDDKNEWRLGRISKDNYPDISLKTETISRKHGKFENNSGFWIYVDYNGKNGTVYNKKHLSVKGKAKQVSKMLEDGDVFVFGGGDQEVINEKTVWGMYVAIECDDEWRIVDSKNYIQIQVLSNGKSREYVHPEKGMVIREKDGIAIYMGSLMYLLGEIEVIGS